MFLYVLSDDPTVDIRRELGLDAQANGEDGGGLGMRARETGFREFGLGAQVLRNLGVRRIEVMTNNPRKIIGLEGFGIEVVGSVPLALL